MFETSGDLRYYVIRENLIWQRLIAAFVALLFGGGAVAMFLYSEDRDTFAWFFSISTMLIAVGSLIFLLTTFETTTTIDARDKKIILERNSLIASTTDVFGFDEIAGEAFIETTKGTRGDAFNQILLPLHNRAPVSLTIEARYNRNRDLKPIADSINEIIFPHEKLPFEVTILDED